MTSRLTPPDAPLTMALAVTDVMRLKGAFATQLRALPLTEIQDRATRLRAMGEQTDDFVLEADEDDL